MGLKTKDRIRTIQIGRIDRMTVTLIILVSVCVIALIGEALLIIPDKMPWNRRKKK